MPPVRRARVTVVVAWDGAVGVVEPRVVKFCAIVFYLRRVVGWSV
jgi:hypothetical protein